MTDKKVCPLIAANLADAKRVHLDDMECLGGLCAWWHKHESGDPDKGYCAILDVAHELKLARRIGEELTAILGETHG